MSRKTTGRARARATDAARGPPMPRRESICCCRFDLFACWFTAALFGFAAFFFGAPLAPAGFFAFLTGFFFSFFLSSARRRLTSSSRDMSTFVSTLVMAMVRLASRWLLCARGASALPDI